MHTLPSPLRLSALLVAAGCLSAPVPAALAAVGDSLEARVIVRFKADAPVVKARAMRATAGEYEALDIVQRRADALGQRAAWRLQGGRSLDTRTHVVTALGIDSATLRQRLAMDPQVELVAVDRIRRVSRLPNDPIYGNGAGIGPSAGQWYLKPPGGGVVSSINAEQAWDITTGSPNVAVAVIDTGVRLDHPDLAGNLLPGYDMIGAGGGGAVRLAVANDGNLADADPSDPGDWVSQADIDGGSLGTGCTRDDISNSSWHGTRVAGLIGAVSDNGIGMAGVAWTTKIVPIRALGKCGGYDSDILASVRWAVGASVPGLPLNPNPVKVVNMSLGSTGPCTGGDGQLYRDAFAEANSRGAVVVVAAGNSAGKPVDSPANCAGAIAVTGLRHIGTKVGFSSIGPEVALGAPGGNCVNLSGSCLYPLVSTTNSGTQGPVSNTYTYNGASVGTSFATPLVAGVAALLFARNPNLTPAEVRTALVSSTRPYPSTGAEAGVAACAAPSSTTEQLECYCTTSTCGTGMLDARAALLGVPAAPAPAPTPAPSPAPSPTPSPSPAPAPAATGGGGGGGASHPLWLLALGLAAWCLPARRRQAAHPATVSGSQPRLLSPPQPPAG